MNEEARLPLLLGSLQAQTVQPDEIVIADSGSTDRTREIATDAGARVLSGERRGPGEGRNRGARSARGDLLVFVDADCVVPSNLLESVRAAASDPRVVGGAAGFAPESGTGFERLLFFLANGYQLAAILWGVPHNAGYCFFFRRQAFERLGGIREDLLLNETHDVALRSRVLGRFAALPVTVTTSMRRLRAHGFRRTVLWEYVTSTLLYYMTGRAPRTLFRPAPVRSHSKEGRARE